MCGLCPWQLRASVAALRLLQLRVTTPGSLQPSDFPADLSKDPLALASHLAATLLARFSSGSTTHESMSACTDGMPSPAKNAVRPTSWKVVTRDWTLVGALQWLGGAGPHQGLLQACAAQGDWAGFLAEASTQAYSFDMVSQPYVH